MGDVVNLNRYRKQRGRVEEQREAAENRVRFGQAKSERAVQNKDRKKARAEHDSKKLD